MKIKYQIILACLFFFSCKKDPPIPVIENTDCLNLRYNNISAYLNWPGIDTVYNMPRFNPSNSNEIIYVQGITSANKSYLVKRNLSNGQETQIISGIWRRPDWSSKDWIVFNHADNEVWKIKSNGDSLTLLTSDMQGGHNAVWNPDGNKIAFVKQVNSTNYNIVCDVNGYHLDTIPYFGFYLNKWSNDGLNICALASDRANVVCENVTSHQIFQPTGNVLDASSSNLIYGDAIDWTPDTKYLFWANPYGIYRTDVTTKQTIKIKTACNSKYYAAISISGDGKKIIAQRTDQKVENNILYVKNGLSIMDIDGKNEILIK